MLEVAGRIQLARGARARAEELWRQLGELAERTHLVSLRLHLVHVETTKAIVDGRLEHAIVLIRRYAELAEESGATIRGRVIAVTLQFAPALYLGRADAWLAAFDEIENGLSYTRAHRRAVRAVCLAHLGRMEEARALAGPILDDIERGGAGDDDLPIEALAFLLEAAVLLERREAAGALVERLACISHMPITAGVGLFYTCVARHLGDAARLLGYRTSARAYYSEALEAAGKIGYRPEMALTHLRFAELLLEEPDDLKRLEAREHLRVAIPELQDTHMRPALERALALSHADLSGPEQAPGRPAAFDTLTGREREIAGLIANGLSNREIADRLVITEGTVEVHVKHILSKLGFRSRTEVAGWLLRRQDGSPRASPTNG